MVAFDRFDGAILIDKPVGPTSHDVVDAIRRAFRFEKTGHCGTLDPNATGLLIIVVGKGTKLSEKLMSDDKVYEGSIKFGETTDSYDADGELLSSLPVLPMTVDELNEAAGAFQGDLLQLPPMVSAVKIKGVPLYKMARKGLEVERKPRLIHVYNFRFSAYVEPFGRFRIACTKGTYVRALAHELGAKLGCGAHLATLRRVASGKFDVKDAVTFEDVLKMPERSAKVRHPFFEAGSNKRSRLMKVIHAADQLSADGRRVCAAIGVFDGVHLGHQSVLHRAISDATPSQGVSVVVTFDRHPNSIVAPTNVPAMIYPLAKKLEILASLGIDAAYVIRFDKAFSQIPGAQFVRDLARDFGRIHSVCVGADFMFGHRRSGNVALLQEIGGKSGFAVHAVPDVNVGGQPVSSTRIRDAVRSGDFALAGQMLGRPHTLCGPVIQGRQLGRQLGFPTANIDVTGILVPPSGVYAADARVGTECRRAAVNIGHRPTVHSGDAQVHVEAYLLDFDRDLVGQDLELTFLKRLREEKKFPSTEALRAQIAQDITQTRDL